MTGAGVATATIRIGRWKERAFYTGMSVTVIAAVFRGFTRTYFFRSDHFSTALAPIAQVHGAIFLSWTLLFLTQTVLVARRQTDVHRRLGFAIPMGNMIVFPSLVAAALIFRRQPEMHKRLMLLATISILDAAVARWPLAIMASGPVAFSTITDLFVLPGLAFDVASRGRAHPAYVWGGLLLIGSQILRLAVSHTAAWIAFAKIIAA